MTRTALMEFTVVLLALVPGATAVHKLSQFTPVESKAKTSPTTSNNTFLDKLGLLDSLSGDSELSLPDTVGPTPYTFPTSNGWRDLLATNSSRWNNNYPSYRRSYYISWFKRDRREESSMLLVVGGLQSGRLNDTWIYTFWSNSWLLLSSSSSLPGTYALGYQVLPTLCQTFVVLVRKVDDVWCFSGRTETWTRLSVDPHNRYYQSFSIQGAVSVDTSTRNCLDCICSGSVFIYGIAYIDSPNFLQMRELQCNESLNHRLSCHWRLTNRNKFSYKVNTSEYWHAFSRVRGLMAVADNERRIIYFSKRLSYLDFYQFKRATIVKYDVETSTFTHLTFPVKYRSISFRNMFVWNGSYLMLSDQQTYLAISLRRQTHYRLLYSSKLPDLDNGGLDVVLTMPSVGPVRFHWNIFSYIPRVFVYRAVASRDRGFPIFSFKLKRFPPPLFPGCLRLHASVYKYDSQILYVYGGEGCDHNASRSSAGNMWELSMSSNTWWLLRPRKVPRTHIANCMSYSGSNVVLFGGRYGNGSVVNELWLYNIIYRTWSERKLVERSWPEARAGCSITSMSGVHTLALFGGYLKDGKGTSDVWLLSLHESSPVWTKMTFKSSKSVPAPRFGHSGVTVGSELIVYGGMGSLLQDVDPVCLTDMWAFSFSSRSWRELVSLPVVPRLQYGSFSLDRRFDLCGSFLLPYGGRRVVVWENTVVKRDESVHNSIWMMDLMSMKRTSLPAPDNLVLVQASAILNGSVVLYGHSPQPSGSGVDVLLEIGESCSSGSAQLDGPAGSCTSCPIGRYTNYFHQVGDCLSCPRGLTTRERGASSITNCLCDDNYCKHGSCHKSPTTDNEMNVVCKCPISYTGERCETISYDFFLLVFGVLTVLIVFTTVSVCYGVRIVRHRRTRKQTERELEETRRAFTILPQEIQLLGRLDEDCPGGYGQVHKAQYRDWVVAVKQLQFVMAEWADIRREFLREIQFMRTVRHPNIVMFIGAGQYSTDNPFLILEFMSGGALRSLLQDSSVEIATEEKIGFILDAAEGMKYLHTLKPPRIHRDLKSANLLVSATKNIKVSDFGSARLISMKSRVLTKRNSGVSNARKEGDLESENLLKEDANLTNRHIGTARWRSPELWKQKPYGTATDVYSFGIVIWEIVTRQTPFSGQDYRFDSQVEDAVLAGTRPVIPDTTTKELNDLMSVCWKTKPSDRPQFVDVVVTLRRLLQQVPQRQNLDTVDNSIASYCKSVSKDNTTEEVSGSVDNPLLMAVKGDIEQVQSEELLKASNLFPPSASTCLDAIVELDSTV